MLSKFIHNWRLASIATLASIFFILFSTPIQAAANQTSNDTLLDAGNIVASSSIPIAALVIAVTVFIGAWCMVKGTTIGASAMIERPETASWGLTLNVMGALVIAYGLVIAMLILMPGMFSLLILLVGGIPIVALALLAYTSWHMRATVHDGKTFSYITYSTIVSIIIVLVSSISIWMSGGEIMIPETAWPLLLGAITMVGSGFCAALCIIAAVNAGSKAMLEKPELSIWSLLFVALGEGLAIYGLIVAILIIMA